MIDRRSAYAAALACFLTASAGAGAADAPGLDADALIGPSGTTLEIAAPAGTTTLEHVHVQIRPTTEGATNATRVVNAKDIRVVDGIASVPLGEVERGGTVETEALVREGEPARIVVRRATGPAKLRPDVAVAEVHARPQALTTKPFDVVVDLEERKQDTAAQVSVTLMLGPTPVAPAQQVTVPAGGEVSVRFPGIHITTPMEATLTANVGEAKPGEYDTKNNSGSAMVDVTEHELNRGNVLVEALGGYGAQFNNHVYAPITPWPQNTPYTDFEKKVRDFQPHIVRIFYNDSWDGNSDGRFPTEWPLNYASFVKSAKLAQEAGATIEISFQRLTDARRTPAASMEKFAAVLEDLVRNHGLTNVRWAEVGNEPNSTAVTLAEYENLNRLLDAQLRARGLREQIRLMGGGLVENAGNAARNHYEWMKWLGANMNDVFDAWAEHVYWNYNDTGRLEYRLRDSWHLFNEELPVEQRKPVYMMEFGVRGLANCPGKTARANTYYAADPSCPEIWRTNIGAFQQLWFAIGSAQLGYAGAAKWDAYWGVYDLTVNPPQVYWAIGPVSEGSPLMPTYHAMSLLFRTTEPGWQVVEVRPWDETDNGVPAYGVEGHSSNDTPEQELAAYTGPNGALTVLGLDTRGRALNGVAAEPPSSYSIGGLPASTDLHLAVWNASGDGTTAAARTVTTSAAGVARFEVPLHAGFALTTVPD